MVQIDDHRVAKGHVDKAIEVKRQTKTKVDLTDKVMGLPGDHRVVEGHVDEVDVDKRRTAKYPG